LMAFLVQSAYFLAVSKYMTIAFFALLIYDHCASPALLTNIQAESMPPISTHPTRGNEGCVARTPFICESAVPLQPISRPAFRRH
jgi:hypothetical protein